MHVNYSNAPGDGGAWVEKPRRGLFRMARGGGWLITAAYCRSAYRDSSAPDHRVYDLGFRLVRTYR